MDALETTEDAILDGRLRLRQPARGYRINVDTILLAAAVRAPSGARLMEAGCGVGAASLAVAMRNEGVRVLGIERDQNIAEIARENVAMNAMLDRVEIATGDVLERNVNWGVFDGVFVNPPFDAEGEGRAPAPQRAYAHVSEASPAQWVAALCDRLTGGAALTIIQRAANAEAMLAALEGRLGSPELYPIRVRAEAAAHRVIICARKGGRAALKLWKGLDLHDGSGGKYTAEAEAILRGEAALAWG
ncbi:MAG: tRNA1(Val) (adenine(37)-N6)-methyltransferase [Hyphomonadaceae bacterium]